MKGRKPKSDYLKLVTGNPGRRPLKAGLTVDAPAVLPDPPPFLCHLGREEWNRVVPLLVPLGLFSPLDVAVLASYCASYVVWRQATAALNAMAETDAKFHGLVIETRHKNLIPNPLLTIRNRAAADVVKFGAEFGLSPTSRARLSPSSAPAGDGGAEKYFR